MKWWVIALIATVAWVGLCLAYGCFFFPSKTTPEQDAILSEKLGAAVGAGTTFLWALIFVAFRNKPNAR